MPTFKLDGRDIPFEPGDTIIRAAHRVGIDIPHYCWHPGLSVAANCRMCLVEIGPPPGRPAMMLSVLQWDEEAGEYVEQRKPKLQPACQIQVAEGMDVKSEASEHVAKARSAVQELLLLNHPVDCPICDQAGECRLQDYWLEHQGSGKRMHQEPVHKPKAVVFGPTIVYDAERCIVCTRCIRFCEEVAKDPVLDLRERGNLNEVVLAPGRELDHPYTLMTEYICPVGALTAQDFRFKARVWFLRTARAVCQGCATGCNAFLDYDPRNQTVYRYRPRENEAVNGHWMCDEGMLDYRRIHEGRVLEANLKGKSAAVGEALDELASRLKRADPGQVAVVLSAEHSNEDNFALAYLAQQLGTSQRFLSGKPRGEGDDVLRHEDKNSNTAGATARAGASAPRDMKALAEGLSTGRITTVLALGSSIGELEDASPFEDCQFLAVLSAHSGPLSAHASVSLPAASWAECEGTFVNAKGIEQVSEAAIELQGEARPAWKLLAALGVRLGFDCRWQSLEQVRAAQSPQRAPAADGHPAVGASS